MTKAFKTRLLSGVLVALVALATGGPARSSEEKSEPHPYVVIVGISQYHDKQIKPRPHAEADAKALYELFTNKDYLGVPAKNIRLLLGDSTDDKSQPATRENILKALHWVDTVAKANDPVIFAFIGEGGPIGNSGDRRCYFAVDSTFKGRDKDAVAADEIGEALKGLKSNRFCAFLDSISRASPTAARAWPTSAWGLPPTRNSWVMTGPRSTPRSTAESSSSPRTV